MPNLPLQFVRATQTVRMRGVVSEQDILRLCRPDCSSTAVGSVPPGTRLWLSAIQLLADYQGNNSLARIRWPCCHHTLAVLPPQNPQQMHVSAEMGCSSGRLGGRPARLSTTRRGPTQMCDEARGPAHLGRMGGRMGCSNS